MRSPEFQVDSDEAHRNPEASTTPAEVMPPPPPPPLGRLPAAAVKQVTKSNFAEALEQFRDHVRTADFIAVSTQKTGSAIFPSSASSLSSSARVSIGGSCAPHFGWRRVLSIDTPETAYLKLKLSAERFELLQFSVCPFRLQDSMVIAHPYNFHLFPRDELKLGMPSHGFSCQTSTITSLANEGFDFNACIYDGLSYVSRVQESITKDRNPIWTVVPITPKLFSSVADRIFMEQTNSKIQQWRMTTCGGCIEDPLVRSLKKLMLGDEVYGSRPCLTISVCNDHQVQLVMEALRRSFEDLVPLIMLDSNGKPTTVKIVLSSSEDDKKLLLREIQHSEEESDRKLRGFREVIDILSSSVKPIITYKALNEFAFIHSKFVGSLPPSMAEFMCSLRLVFPNIVDINYMLKEISSLRKANNNRAAMSYLRREFPIPTVMEIPDQDCDKVDKSHGCIVLRITDLFAKLSLLLKIDSIDCRSTPGLGNKIIETYSNVFHHWCTVFEVNMKNEDPWMKDFQELNIDNLVFIWGFGNLESPGALKQRLCGAHDAFSEDFELKMLDKSCAVVVVRKPNLLRILLRDVSGNIQPGALADVISGGLRIAGYEAYRKVCEMGLWEMDLADAFDKLLSDCTDISVNMRVENSVVYWRNELMVHPGDA